MSDWYEVFDNEHVQSDTRKRVARLVGFLIAAAVAAVAIVPLFLAAQIPLLSAIGIAALGLGAVLGLASRAFLRLRSVVWCIKLSVHRVVGYDYARRKAVLAWTEVERVEIDDAGLLIVGAPRENRLGRVLRVPHVFPDFAHLGHRVVEYAEAHGLPVCIAGRPWQLLDVSALYPFMAAIEIVGTVEEGGGRALDGGA